MMIPVFEPVIGEDEIQAVVQALRRGEISGSFGESIPRFEQAFAEYVGCKFGVAVNSGTSALMLAVAAARVGEGDHVLVSTSTNIATALGVYHKGGIPIPVDSENITWNMDLDLLEDLITPDVRAILPVHLYGHPVDMDRLMEIARKYDLAVIEDCAESHGATVRDRMTGSFGDMACFSFYANKVITTGEGGMVVTNDEAIYERLKLLRNLAFTEPRFWHEYPGYNFRMTGYTAAMGLAQLEKIEEIITQKRRVAHSYNQFLEHVPGLQLPVELDWAKNVYWMYAIVVKPEFDLGRDELAEFLLERGIQTRTFFCPMNQQPFLQDMPGFQDVPCPVADQLWEQGLYLPSSINLSVEVIEEISTVIKDANANARK